MKKQYQIDRERAVGKFHEQAKHSEESLQLTLPLKEVAAALQEGVGQLMRQACLELMQLVMDNEVRHLAGERYERRSPEQPFRWGREKGFLIVDGQKVPIERPRMRSEDGREQRLGSYELFRRSEPLDAAVWDKLMLGLSTRNYSKAVREFAASYGIEKSAVSDHFVRVSREKLGELLERPLDKLQLCVVYLDGIEFKGQHLVVALGVAVDGAKTVLGLRQGASENAPVVGELLDDLVERGVDFSAPMLYVLDGSKALTKAVRKHAGTNALWQRCQLHKRRNVTAHLPADYRDSVERKMINAYQMTHYEDAKKALEKLHRELMELNPVGGALVGGGNGGDADGAAAPDRRGVACDVDDNEPDRVGVFGGRPRFQPSQVLAAGRSPRALGRRGPLARRTQLPACQGLQTVAPAVGATRPAQHAASGSG